MKIDNTMKPGLKSVGAGAGAGAGRATRAPGPAGAGPEAAAEVALSPLATRLQELSASLASTPAMDAVRVAEVKQAISEGRFSVDPGKIADGIIESVRQLLSGQR